MKTISNEINDRTNRAYVASAPLCLWGKDPLLNSNRSIEVAGAENREGDRKESLETVINRLLVRRITRI